MLCPVQCPQKVPLQEAEEGAQPQRARRLHPVTCTGLGSELSPWALGATTCTVSVVLEQAHRMCERVNVAVSQANSLSYRADLAHRPNFDKPSPKPRSRHLW